MILEASWPVTAIVATLSALVAGYSYGPREIHTAIYAWVTSPDTWRAGKEIMIGLGALCVWYVIWALTFFCLGHMPLVWQNSLYLLGPAIGFNVVFALVAACASDSVVRMNDFEKAAICDEYYLPLCRLCGSPVCYVTRCFRNDWVILGYVVFMPYLALLIIPVATCVLALDLIVTLAMLPSATARIAIMGGTFCGVMASGLGIRMEFLPLVTVLYGGAVGGGLGFGAYYLRYFLVNFRIPKEEPVLA